MKYEQECHILLIIPMTDVGLSCSLSLSVMQRAMCFRCSWGAETLSTRLNCRGTMGGTVALESILHCRGFCVNNKSTFVGREAEQLSSLFWTVQGMWRKNLCSCFGGFPYTLHTSKQPNHRGASHFSCVFPLSQAQSSSCVEGCSCWKWRGEMSTPLPFRISLVT